MRREPARSRPKSAPKSRTRQGSFEKSGACPRLPMRRIVAFIWQRRRSIATTITEFLCGFLSDLWRSLAPGRIGEEGFDLRRKLPGFGPEILLKYRAVVIDHEGHDARIAVGGGVGDQRKASPQF